MSPLPSRPRFARAGFFLALLILLLATGLRFFRLDAQSYWNDEGNSLRLAERSLSAIIEGAAADIHPPGYYLLLKGWYALLGSTEFALRSFSALCGVVLVALLYQLGQRWFGKTAGVVAALLATTHPFLIYYSQEARMYALLATFSAASFASLDLLLNPQPKIPRWQRMLAYVLTTAAGLYTHYAFGFTLLAEGLAIVLHWGQRPNRRWLPTTLGPPLLVIGLLYLPWAPIAYHQLTHWPAVREFQPITIAAQNLFRYVFFGRTLPVEMAVVGLVSAALVTVWGIIQALTAAPPRWLPVLGVGVPVGLTLALGLLTEAFSKFLIVAVPSYCLLVAASLATPHHPRSVRRFVPPLVFLLALPTLFTSLNNLYFSPAYARDNYRGIAHYLAQLQRPGDAVITISPNQWEVFSYYHDPARGAAPVFPLPHARPLDVAETETALADLTTRFDRLFVLYWGEQQADPQGVVENWLTAHTFKAAESWYGQVRLATYAAATPALTLTTPLNAHFGDPITLLGYALKSRTLAPGDIVQLTLFWQTDAVLDARYKVFLHLYADPNAPPPAQHDSEPGGGRLITSSWQPGQVYADHQGLLIPPDLLPGSYTLALGLYNLFDGSRLPIALDGVVTDRLAVGTLEVR